MSTAEITREYTVDDLIALRDDGKSYELVEGQLEEQAVSNLAGAVASKITVRLGAFAEANRLGEVFNAETLYRCIPRRPKTVRKPDVSFIARDRLPKDWATSNSFTIAPDLAVEVLSPNDLITRVHKKLREYQRAGVKLIWLIDPEQRFISVKHADGKAYDLQESDELTGEDVLPGFRCRVADLFPARASDSVDE